MLKKIISVILLSFFLTLAAASAQTPNKAPAKVGPAGDDLVDFLDETAIKGGLTDQAAGEADVMTIIAGIINTVLSLTGIIFFVQMFYHGFRWMTAAGNDEIIKESKTGIKQSVIGIVIIFSAFVASNFIINRIQLINQPTAAVPGKIYG